MTSRVEERPFLFLEEPSRCLILAVSHSGARLCLTKFNMCYKVSYVLPVEADASNFGVLAGYRHVFQDVDDIQDYRPDFSKLTDDAFPLMVVSQIDGHELCRKIVERY